MRIGKRMAVVLVGAASAVAGGALTWSALRPEVRPLLTTPLTSNWALAGLALLVLPGVVVVAWAFERQGRRAKAIATPDPVASEASSTPPPPHASERHPAEPRRLRPAAAHRRVRHAASNERD